MRARRTHLLYHGTLLYQFDMSLLATCLRLPPRQPDYRASRPHAEFLMNLPATRRQLTDSLTAAWPTSAVLRTSPVERVAALVAERFSQPAWNREFE
jgi:lipoate-protein ligase A